MSEKNRDFDSTDWSNMIDSVCRWKPEEWGFGIVGLCPRRPYSKEACQESG